MNHISILYNIYIGSFENKLIVYKKIQEYFQLQIYISFIYLIYLKYRYLLVSEITIYIYFYLKY